MRKKTLQSDSLLSPGESQQNSMSEIKSENKDDFPDLDHEILKQQEAYFKELIDLYQEKDTHVWN